MAFRRATTIDLADVHFPVDGLYRSAAATRPFATPALKPVATRTVPPASSVAVW